MSNPPIHTVQNRFLEWMAAGEKKRSYEQIRKCCEYLSKAYNLNREGSAIWDIFYPLLRTGVLDHAGNDYYSITEPVAIGYNGVYIYNSLQAAKNGNKTPFPGINRTNDSEDVKGMTIVPFNAVSILKNIPSVNQVVDSFPKSVEELSDVEFYHYNGKQGLTKRAEDGGNRYFVIPDKLYQRELPSRAINPDVFNIAYCYSRSINNDSSGKYISKNSTIQIKDFAFPIILERVLFIETMLHGEVPSQQYGYKEYPCISPSIVKELNRILCNTIVYE